MSGFETNHNHVTHPTAKSVVKAIQPHLRELNYRYASGVYSASHLIGYVSPTRLSKKIIKKGNRLLVNLPEHQRNR